VYSFAVMLVELLADKTPVEGEHIGEYADRALDLHRRPTPRSMGVEVGDAVEAAIGKAVSVNPAERPRDIGEFWGMLKHASQRDQKARESGERGVPYSPHDAAPSAREARRPRVAVGHAGAVNAGPGAAATLASASMSDEIRAAIGRPENKTSGEEGAGVATVARVIDVTDEPPAPAPAPAADARREPTPAPAPAAARAWPSRPSGRPIPEHERPRWHSPSMPRGPSEAPRAPAKPPSRRNFPMLVVIAIGLTVTFVVVAIVATELAR
jgi:hypothetical protein